MNNSGPNMDPCGTPPLISPVNKSLVIVFRIFRLYMQEIEIKAIMKKIKHVVWNTSTSSWHSLRAEYIQLR